jgi:hypothetical protein
MNGYNHFFTSAGYGPNLETLIDGIFYLFSLEIWKSHLLICEYTFTIS